MMERDSDVGEMNEKLSDTEETVSEQACNENDDKNEKECTDSAKLDEALSRIAELEGQIKERDDKYLRMAAEYDNFRRRSREEKEATYENAMADTVARLLPIIDNLERAVACAEEGAMKDGVVMVLKSVGDIFSDMGIESVGAVGDVFDPKLHNAVMHDEDPERGEGEIVEVYQKGYKKGNRMIRFAMVKTVN